MAYQSRFDYINQDMPGKEILAVLGELPKRWGRMDKISRLAVVEVGRVLAEGRRETNGQPDAAGGRGGLIGLTRRGSLATDLAYIATLKQGLEMASPTLFSYTLPNIALAEAASHYGLTGPVYAVFSSEPGLGAEAEARRWLCHDRSLDFMIVGGLDVYPVRLHDGGDREFFCELGEEVVSVKFKMVR